MIPLIHLAARRAARRALVAVFCAAGLAISVPAAAEPGAFEVVGYQGADYSGASKSWTLPAERPYRYVPFVGEDIGGSVASVLAGGGVGAVLFQRPFFSSKDSICAPDIGSDARPDLKWLGATATFAAPFGPEAGRAAANPAAGPKGFASLIIFRKDLGPPPGALLMDRRRTIGSSCRSPAHKISYKRLFVPVTEPPERSRCFNLSGAYRFEDSKEKVLKFTTADRLVLLAPGDYSDLYGNVRHRVTATAYGAPECRGDSLSFKSGSSATDVFKLADFRFRDRARSIRITYDGGPLTPYLSAPPAPVQTPVAKLTPAPAAQTSAAETPAVQTPAAQSAATPAPEAPAKKAIAPVQAEPKQAAAPAKTVQPEPKRQAAAPAEPAKPEPAKPEPAKSEPAKSEPAKSEPKQSAVAQTSGTRAPTAVQQAIPKLTPEALPAPGPAPKSTLADKIFQYPVHDIYRLNYCLRWGTDCGAPAAGAWCKTQGFERASTWQIDKNIGGLFPTILMGDRKVCAQFLCDGFREITCAK